MEKAKKYIDRMDLEPIIRKLTDPSYYLDRWNRKDVQTGVKLYRNFLYLKKKYGKRHPIVPSEEIDEIWHAHILDTRKYIKDCQAIFGEYLHHYPYFGIGSKADKQALEAAFNQTQELYFQEFGEYL